VRRHRKSEAALCALGSVARMYVRRYGHERPMAGQTRPSLLSIRLSSSAFHENRPRALRACAFAHDAKTLGHFSIGREQAAEIATKAVLVELIVGLDVP